MPRFQPPVIAAKCGRLFVLLLAAIAASAAGDAPSALDSLIRAEQSFSIWSVEKGMRDAFLAFLHDDGVIFGPLAVNGKRVWESRPAPQATLIWDPAYAEVSGAGDLGFTIGPWELRPPADAPDRPTLYGHFISIWRRSPAGEWKVALDIGCGHEKPERGVGSGDLSPGPAHTPTGEADRSGMAERELDSAEKAFARAARRGFGAALARWASADVRLHCEGRMPVVGRDSVRAALASDITRARWDAQAVRASRSGDLAYTYGIRERIARAEEEPDSSVFVHVWRRDAERWRVAVVVENPIGR